MPSAAPSEAWIRAAAWPRFSGFSTLAQPATVVPGRHRQGLDHPAHHQSLGVVGNGQTDVTPESLVELRRRHRRDRARRRPHRPHLASDPRLQGGDPLHPARDRRDRCGRRARGRRPGAPGSGAPGPQGSPRRLPGPPEGFPRRRRAGAGARLRAGPRRVRRARPRLLEDPRAGVPRAAERRGAGRRRRGLRALEEAAVAATGRAFKDANEAVRADLDGFVAAPFTQEEQARRAAQLTRFLDLVPIEYDDGTEDGRVTIPFELQEGVAFIDGAQDALDDLEPALAERDPDGVATVEAASSELRTYTSDAHEGGVVVPLEDVEAAHDEASTALESMFPAGVGGAGRRGRLRPDRDQPRPDGGRGLRLRAEQAEQARLSTYAFFEFGPEIKLRAFDPQLVAQVEGLVWYGPTARTASPS